MFVGVGACGESFLVVATNILHLENPVLLWQYCYRTTCSIMECWLCSSDILGRFTVTLPSFVDGKARILYLQFDIGLSQTGAMLIDVGV